MREITHKFLNFMVLGRILPLIFKKSGGYCDDSVSAD